MGTEENGLNCPGRQRYSPCDACHAVDVEKTMKDLEAMTREDLIREATIVAEDSVRLIKDAGVWERHNEYNFNDLVPYMTDSELVKEVAHMYERHVVAKRLHDDSFGANQYTSDLVHEVAMNKRPRQDGSEEVRLMNGGSGI